MFYLSKIVWGILQPSSLLAIVFIAACVFALIGKRLRAIRLFVAGTFLYIVFGFSPLANWLLAPLEIQASAIAAKDLDGAAGIIVLGGAIEGQTDLATGSPRLNEAAGRMTEALRLAVRYPQLPLVFSGGRAELIVRRDKETEAELARRFFEGFNIVPPRLMLEDRSRNTAENAAETAKLLHPQPAQKWILVTSAFHMPRAKALFEAQGFHVLPWPADFKTSGFDAPWRLFPKASDGLKRMDLAMKEWIGLAVSRLLGNLSRH